MRVLLTILLMLLASAAQASEWVNDCDDAGTANVFEDDGAGGDAVDAACLEDLKTDVKDNDDRIETLEAIDPIVAAEIDTSAKVLAIVGDETGSGAMVFGTAPQISSIELGHATDTTITRSAPGVLQVEGINLMRQSSIGGSVQAYDEDLDDLADGSLTGSKVGTGISGTNVTTGTVADARIATTITRDTELDAKSAATSTDNAIARFDSTAGDVQSSGVLIDDSNNLTVPGSITSGTSGGTCLILTDLDDGTSQTACWSENGVMTCEVDTNDTCDDAT